MRDLKLENREKKFAQTLSSIANTVRQRSENAIEKTEDARNARNIARNTANTLIDFMMYDQYMIK